MPGGAGAWEMARLPDQLRMPSSTGPCAATAPALGVHSSEAWRRDTWKIRSLMCGAALKLGKGNLLQVQV